MAWRPGLVIPENGSGPYNVMVTRLAASPRQPQGRRRGPDRRPAATMSRRCCRAAGSSDNAVPLLSPGQQLRDYVAVQNRAQQQRRDDVAAIDDQLRPGGTG